MNESLCSSVSTVPAWVPHIMFLRYSLESSYFSTPGPSQFLHYSVNSQCQFLLWRHTSTSYSSPSAPVYQSRLSLKSSTPAHHITPRSAYMTDLVQLQLIFHYSSVYMTDLVLVPICHCLSELLVTQKWCSRPLHHTLVCVHDQPIFRYSQGSC